MNNENRIYVIIDLNDNCYGGIFTSLNAAYKAATAYFDVENAYRWEIHELAIKEGKEHYTILNIYDYDDMPKDLK